MSGFARMKRVTDPLDDKAKARIVGRQNIITPDYISSGSEHSAQSDDDVTSSSSFSELFFGFDADDDGGDSSPDGNDSDSDDRDPSVSDSNFANVDLINQIVRDQRDAYKKLLVPHVLKAVQVFSCLQSNKQIMRRNVMAYLRNCGYNAAICKSTWQNSGGLTAGNYEFIDIVRSENSSRYFVDLDFASEFEIARPTSSYQRLIECLPRVFVGTSEDLKRILRVMSDAARRSLKSRDLYMPPWRKHRFMQNKWLGSYRRTTNVFPTTSFSSSLAVKQQGYAVKCRAVGFDAAVNGGGLMFPVAARTR